MFSPDWFGELPAADPRADAGFPSQGGEVPPRLAREAGGNQTIRVCVSSPAIWIRYVFMKHFCSADKDSIFFFLMNEVLVRKYQSELAKELNRNILL